jgi:HD-like signal output (HDOD) protein
MATELDEATKTMLAEIQRGGHLPALDMNVHELCRLAGDSHSNLPDLTAVILRDPAITTFILSIANSAAYRTSGEPIRTVSSAVVMMGFERVKSLVLGMFIFKQSKENVKSRDLYRLFTCAYFSGSFCVALARRARLPNSEELFVAGLLHELPRLMLANTFPDKYHAMEALILKEGLPADAACQRVFGVSFAGLSRGICEHWHLPESILSVLPAVAGTTTSPRTSIMREATQLADMMFGNTPGGAVNIGETQQNLRKLLKDDKFSVEDFASTICDEDQNLTRFFKINAKDVGMMVKITEWGKANAAQVAMDLAYGSGLEALEKKESPPQVQIGAFMTELALCARRHTDINGVLLLAQEALYKCIQPDFLFTALTDHATATLRGRLYVGADLAIHARDFAIDLTKKDALIPMQLRSGKAGRLQADRARLGLPDTLKTLRVHHTMLVPIIICGKTLGAYVLGRGHDQPFTDEELDWVEAVETHVALAFEPILR